MANDDYIIGIFFIMLCCSVNHSTLVSAQMNTREMNAACCTMNPKKFIKCLWADSVTDCGTPSLLSDQNNNYTPGGLGHRVSRIDFHSIFLQNMQNISQKSVLVNESILFLQLYNHNLPCAWFPLLQYLENSSSYYGRVRNKERLCTGTMSYVLY